MKALEAEWVQCAAAVGVWLVLSTGCGNASDSLGPTSGVDGGLTIDVISERDTRRLCDWSVRTLGGEGTKYDAPCVNDAPAGTTIEVVVLSASECTRRLLAYEFGAYTVMNFEECTHDFVDGGCGSGCLPFSVDYPEDAAIHHPQD